jgi:hypothetical protein
MKFLQTKINIVSILICIIILSPNFVGAATTRVIQWDFNNATYLDSSGGDTGADWFGGFSSSVLTTDSPSPESGGNSLLAHISSLDSSTGIGLRKGGSWSIREFYVSLWMYIHTDISNDELESIKLFSVNDDASSYNFQAGNWFIFNVYQNEFHLYGSNVSGTYSGPGKWSGFLQGGWHKYEVYVKYNDVGQSNGIVRVWIDNALKWERTNLNYWSSSVVVNSFYAYPHFKTFGSKLGYIDGYVQVDDVELWDGMPGETDTTPPAAPTGVTVI